MREIPSGLLDGNCRDCDDIIQVRIVESDEIPVVRVNYLKYRQNLFLIEFDFQNKYRIPIVTCEISINPKYSKWFNEDEAKETQRVRIDPALLARYDEHD